MNVVPKSLLNVSRHFIIFYFLTELWLTSTTQGIYLTASTSFKMPSAETLVNGTDFSTPSSKIENSHQHPATCLISPNAHTMTSPQSWLNSAALTNQDGKCRVVALDVHIEFLHKFSAIQNVNKSKYCCITEQIDNAPGSLRFCTSLT